MNTPFDKFLYTNAVPSDADCQHIRELLVGPREELAKLTEEIAHLHTLLDELTAKRDRLSELIDPYLALVSPARRLPDDVVAEIFTASLPSNRNAIMSGAESPLLLCQICRAWRSLAFMTPRLWASLHIVAPSDSSKVGRLNDAVNLWLSRSGALPLSISIVRSHTATSEPDISMLLESLIHYSPRWNRMKFMLRSHNSFAPLAALSPHDVPILESIVVEGFRRYGPSRHFSAGHVSQNGVDWNFVSFLGTASLRSVSLTRIVESSKFPLPWARLRHLSLGRFLQQIDLRLSGEQGLKLLRQCPNLETCTLLLHSPAVEKTVPCHMEHLRQLCVIDKVGMGDFFRNLVLPNLRSLEYASQKITTSLPFTSILQSPNCLRQLSLGITIMPTPAVLVDCLRLVPTLHALCLHGEPSASEGRGPSSDGAFLTYLTQKIQDSGDIICPELRSIRLFKFFALTDAILLEFIQARSIPRHKYPAPLSNVDVEFTRRRQIDIRAPLAQLIADGLKLTLKYFEPSIVYSVSEGNQSHTAEWEPISENWRRL
ncbi:hypothetical protein C8R44DRAFT_254026 [Mycena epipterygia]|nr:hypothetical protein C8R44DRAFT_254026 [Mycena epipterygia]